MKEPLVRFSNVSKKYYINNHQALRGIDLEIPRGSIYGIIGKNGAGKSTLFRCMTGLENPDEGSIFLDGEKIEFDDPKKLRDVRKHIGVVFQQLNLFSSRTVEENISYPLEIHGVPVEERQVQVNRILSLMGLEGKRHKYPSQLSGGEKQRVAIGRAIVTNPKLLLCDEATSALDTQTFAVIVEVLKKLNKELGITILVITHQAELVRQLCTHVALLKDGCLDRQGSKESILMGDLDPFVSEFIGEVSDGR